MVILLHPKVRSRKYAAIKRGHKADVSVLPRLGGGSQERLSAHPPRAALASQAGQASYKKNQSAGSRPLAQLKGRGASQAQGTASAQTGTVTGSAAVHSHYYCTAYASPAAEYLPGLPAYTTTHTTRAPSHLSRLMTRPARAALPWVEMKQALIRAPQIRVAATKR